MPIREIIDESDVYIDVHKAIRRLAPAPHARMHNPPVKAPAEPDLIDVNDATPTDRDALLPKNKALKRTDTPSQLSSSPKTTFLMRRSSNSTDGIAHNPPMSVRGNIGDMREHLKHLGPSNLASRPNTTRYQSVKIKPGNTGFSNAAANGENKPRQISVAEENYSDMPAAQGGTGEGLINAGKGASDGVQALQQGYGTMDQGSRSPDKPLVLVDGLSTEAKPSQSTAGLEQQPTPESSHSSDTLGELKSRDSSPSGKQRGVARSGSITENVVDVGGIRKVILETTSSSDDAERNNTQGKENASLGESSQQSEQTGESQGGGAKKPNKRRRNRKKGGKGGGSPTDA